MASGGSRTNDDGDSVTNGDIYCSPDHSGTLEETVEQVNNLIQLNQDLRAALRQTNLTMKVHFEGLSAWKDKQQQKQQDLERQLEETQRCVETMALVNQELQERLITAEEALAAKQKKIEKMKEEMLQKEKELETMSVLKAQAEVYSSDFYTERAEREKLHEEKEHLVYELEDLRRQNMQLQQEVDSKDTEEHQSDTGQLVCPKCGDIFPNIDSIRIHLMDCVT